MCPPDITVVIPARNGAGTLPRVLAGLRAQLPKVPHTVVIVDDGSTDDTKAVAQAQREESPEGYLTVISTGHRGTAAARNRGARHATAPLILFLGSDILPQARLLERHRHIHRRFPGDRVGCLGHVTWDPALPPSPFMVFLEHGGPQNAYGEIAGKEWVEPEKYWYGANVSLKTREFLSQGGFCEDVFSGYGWEDIEFGFRLAREGFRLYYEPTARGLHHHAMTLDMSLQRMRDIGVGARRLQALHPKLVVFNMRRERKMRLLRPLLFPAPVRVALRMLARRLEHRFLAVLVYRRVLSLLFYDGVHEPEKK